MPYNPEFHKRRSIRLPGYDYAQAGLYFVTICVHNKERLFGRIIHGVMLLNEAGHTANRCWMEIPQHFTHAVLHEYVIMPNHVHGIIELKNVVGAKDFSPLLLPGNGFRSPSRTIGSIVRGFKIGVTKWFRYSMPDDFPLERPIWQRNYYEHIIRNQESYQRISEYIIHNPAKWQEDRFYEK